MFFSDIIFWCRRFFGRKFHKLKLYANQLPTFTLTFTLQYSTLYSVSDKTATKPQLQCRFSCYFNLILFELKY